MHSLSRSQNYSSLSCSNINQPIDQPKKVWFQSSQRHVQPSSNEKTIGLQSEDSVNLESTHQSKEPSTFIIPDSEGLGLENVDTADLQARQLLESNMRSVTPDSLQRLRDELNSTIDNLPNTERNINENDELLKDMAQTALGLLSEIDFNTQGKLKCKSPCDIASSLAWEVPVCLLFYVGATINLAVFVGTAEDGEKLKQAFNALGASLATGPMYLQGLLSFLDNVAAPRNNKNSSTESKFDRLAKMITPWFNDPVKAVKGLSIAGITAMSVYLDAKNSANGVTRLTGLPTLGLAAGIFNGVTEGLLPLAQLDQTWKSIADHLPH